MRLGCVDFKDFRFRWVQSAKLLDVGQRLPRFGEVTGIALATCRDVERTGAPTPIVVSVSTSTAFRVLPSGCRLVVEKLQPQERLPPMLGASLPPIPQMPFVVTARKSRELVVCSGRSHEQRPSSVPRAARPDGKSSHPLDSATLDWFAVASPSPRIKIEHRPLGRFQHAPARQECAPQSRDRPTRRRNPRPHPAAFPTERPTTSLCQSVRQLGRLVENTRDSRQNPKGFQVPPRLISKVDFFFDTTIVFHVWFNSTAVCQAVLLICGMGVTNRSATGF